jgi:choline dehydrogenase
MLSGVGPKSELEKHGITVVNTLEGVGKGLKDHLFTPIAYNTTLPSLHTEESIGNVLEWARNGKGPLTSNVGEIISFHNSEYSKVGEKPDYELCGGPLFFVDHGFEVPPKGMNGVTLGVVLLYPKSTGSVTLRSANFKDSPLIDTNYLADKKDMDVIISGIKYVRKVFSTEPISKHLDQETHPGSKYKTNEELSEHVKKYSQTLYHPTSTCKMGKDDMSVVDHNLKVYGVKSLRVIDASIFPDIVGGHTNIPTAMVAERAVDLILNDHK